MNTNTAIVKQEKASALNAMAQRYSVEPAKLLDTLKATVFKGATNEELMALVVVSNEYELNPFTKQIYAFPAKGGGITPVVGVDGWAAILNKQKDFDGIEFEMQDDEEGKPHSCTAIIYAKSRQHPVKVTEYYSECFRGTEPWKGMPRRMLRHKALSQGVRVAFGLTGLYDEDEALDISRNSYAAPNEKPAFGKTKAAESLPDATAIIDVVPMSEAEKEAIRQRELKEAK
jgi:phage recombination protein Bet